MEEADKAAPAVQNESSLGLPQTMSNKLIASLLFALLHSPSPAAHLSAPQTKHVEVGNRAVAYEVLDAGTGTPLVIVLPGTSGPDAPYYRDRTKLLQSSGFTVLLMHYFDAAPSRNTSVENYWTWVGAVQELVRECNRSTTFAHRKIAVVGYSLGASIALAAGSQGLPVAGIADWYGSLPDPFFEHIQGMPPLLILHGSRDGNIPVINSTQLIRLCEMVKFSCESHIYPDQAHGFTGRALDDADQRTAAFLSRIFR